MQITKLDKQRRIQIPKRIAVMFPEGQRFSIEVDEGKIILTPIKTIKVELDDGTVIEV